MPYAVQFTPEADGHLAALYDYIAAEATPVTAERYITTIINHCVTLARSPSVLPRATKSGPACA